MSRKNMIIEFGAVFAVTLVTVALVTFLWNFIGHGAGLPDWETAFRLVITFGVVLTWAISREKNNIGVFISLELQKGWKV